MTTARRMAAASRGEMARALKAIADGRCKVVAEGGQVGLADGAGAAVRFRIEVLAALASRGLLRRAGDALRLTPEGSAWLRRATAAADPYQDQHREIEAIEIPLPGGGKALASVNLAESPLGQLARRRDRNGRAFLSEAEVRAGEKLRADYTLGQIMPRVSANWNAAVVTGRRGAPAAEITDAALAARVRVERALDAAGPELAGVLVDVCCFLKGLETVEVERGWPVRSAKVMLKTALAALARHYEPVPAGGAQRGRRRIVSWGAANYRPTIGRRGRQE